MPELITQVFTKTPTIDVGAGLRAHPSKGDRYDPSNAWLTPYVTREDHHVLDITDQHGADIVADIHTMPLEDNSIGGFFCIAVLEHVRNPFQAIKEIHRVLQPGGLLYLYVPFLFPHHSDRPYSDYWRFTDDAVQLMLSDFSNVSIYPTTGLFETWAFNSPIRQLIRKTRFHHKHTLFRFFARQLDTFLPPTKHSSGFIALARK